MAGAQRKPGKTKGHSSHVPPYMRITPEDALKDLGPAAGTAEFARLAAACETGRTELVARGLDDQGEKRLRLFSTWEITRYQIPVAQAHFRRVLKANPELPQGQSETKTGAKWFTLEDVLKLREYFAAEGSKTKPYKPFKPEGLPAKIIAVANFKGGVGKTSTTVHLAMSAALDGYRVLVVDLDSQGSMTSIFGGKIADEWNTVFPLLARDYARHMQSENRARVARGDNPAPLDDVLSESLKMTTHDVIQKTHWPNIDMIGAQLNLYWAEFQIPVWRMATRGWKLWEALSNALAADKVLEDYDLIFLDTPPALGYLTINGLAAADIILVPAGANFLEFDSTGRFFDMLQSTFGSIEESENIAARALGREELRFEWDAVQIMLTRYDATQQAELATLMQAWLGRTVMQERQEFTALIGQAGEQVHGLYEADYRDFNRETYMRGRETFDATYAAFKRLVVGIWQRDLTKQNIETQ